MADNKLNMSAMVIVGILVVFGIGYGLVRLASGTSYALTVTNPSVGPEDAPVVIEEFADFQCPGCKAASTAVEEIVRSYPTQVRLVYRDFPIPGHQHARLAAAAGLCAAQQGKFMEYYKKAFSTQDEWARLDRQGFDTFLMSAAGESGLGLDLATFNECRNSRDAKAEVEKDYQEGISRTVNSTPTFFINGTKYAEVPTVFQLIQLINAELEKKGLTPENNAANS